MSPPTRAALVALLGASFTGTTISPAVELRADGGTALPSREVRGARAVAGQALAIFRGEEPR